MKSLDEPRVSVIIPAFNIEQHIGETLDSLECQTFRSFEALVVDDCSTDRTASIVRARAALDPRIRYIRLESNSNRPAVPRNRGLAEAKGEFVAFLDHDDLWFRRKLERQIRVLDSFLIHSAAAHHTRHFESTMLFCARLLWPGFKFSQIWVDLMSVLNSGPWRITSFGYAWERTTNLAT